MNKSIFNANWLWAAIAICFMVTASAQSSHDFTLSCRVFPVVSAVHVTETDASVATTLLELNPHFKSEWIRRYVGVEISGNKGGRMVTAKGTDGVLTSEQRDIIRKGDIGSQTEVVVRYIPENTLPTEEVKEMKFSFVVRPDQSASFPGGKQALQSFLKEKIFDPLDKTVFKQHQLTALGFAVNEAGQIVDIRLLQTSGSDETDAFLSAALCNMPTWKPAEYANGQKTDQRFVLTLGDMHSCVVNLLNIGVHTEDALDD